MLAPSARAADPVIAAAGDIACATNSPYFNGGAGTPTRCRQGDTANLLAPGLAAVLPLGDAQFCCGALDAFTASYAPTWGRLKAVTRPVLGNREYGTSNADGYFDYFNGAGASSGPAGKRGEGFYSYDVGAWHLIALNSNCTHVGCAVGSDQDRWLHADLAAHPNACTLAYAHNARFSSGKPGSSISFGPMYKTLYQAGVDIVLGAHSRSYERFALQNHVGKASPKFGIREFVVGTGGHSLGAFGTSRRNSEVRDNTTFGVLELTLAPTGYSWRFLPVAGATFTDSGTGACHGAPPRGKPKPKPKPKPVSKNGCTLRGTPGNDVLRGTPGKDVICGLDGNDRIYGLGGNDVLRGGNGRDRIAGGDGRDRAFGNRGNDVLAGGRGRDIVHGGAGNDVIRGQGGADRLFGEGGNNRVFGNAGRDFIVVSRNGQRDFVDGGRGRDRCKVQPGDHVRAVERVSHVRKRK
jgi:hypothetical protein